MYDYYEEPYCEPSIADEIFAEYLNKMKNALTENTKYQIEKIKIENEELKEEYKKLSDKQHQVAIKERELLEKERILERQFYSKKFSELLKPFTDNYSGYYADDTYKKVKKCEKCDSDRKIIYTSPYGDKIKKDCLCNRKYNIYEPKHTVIEVLSLWKNNYDNKFGITPKYESKSDDYKWSKLEFTHFIDVFDETIADNIKKHDTLFKSKEECQKYCDWLNRDINEEVEDEVELLD